MLLFEAVQLHMARAADAAIAPWWPGPDAPGAGAAVISIEDPDTGKVPSVSHWPASADWLTGTVPTTWLAPGGPVDTE